MNSTRFPRPKRKAKFIQVITWINPKDLYEIDEMIWSGVVKSRSEAIRNILDNHFKKQKDENSCITL